MSRNTPATTIVLECSNADTKAAPSIAEGTHGSSRNRAEFNAADRSRPINGMFGHSLFSIKIC